MRRSLLFIPGNNPAMLQNANLFNADGVIFDLEDAVSIDDKDSARILVESFLSNIKEENLEIIIRINGLDTIYYEDDLDSVISDNIDTLMVPKASYKDLIKLDKVLSSLEEKRKLTKKIKIIPIIELATSLLECKEIASVSRLDGILLGAEDLTSDMEVNRTPEGEEIAYARSVISLVCKAYKIDAIDTPFTNVTDEEGLLKDCKKAQTFGMNAKACIHPNQIGIVNELFSPTEKQIQYALEVVRLSKTNGGVFSINGKMVDKPIIERSIKLLEKAKKFGLLS